MVDQLGKSFRGQKTNEIFFIVPNNGVQQTCDQLQKNLIGAIQVSTSYNKSVAKVLNEGHA